MIQLHDVSVTFHPGSALENSALKNIELTIFPGDFITLIGSNGAGKSTLMGVVSGEIPITQGKITFDGVNITQEPVEKRAPMISRVFQDPRTGVCETLTLEENLAFAIKRGQSRNLTPAYSRDLKEKYIEALKKLEINLENRLQDSVGLLSGGQRQALSLVMATLQPCKILLLDEPTAALDPTSEKTVLSLIKKITSDQKLTTLMVTHNMSHASTLGNRTILMHQGKIKQESRKENTP